MKPTSLYEKLSISLLVSWMLLFTTIPFLGVLLVSFLQHKPGVIFHWNLTLENYQQLLDPIYLKVFAKSFFLAGLSTLICLLLAYPFAFILTQIKSPYKSLLLVLVIIPFWTSSLIRSYAMVVVIKAKGLINSFLLFLGLIDEPMQLLFTNTAVLIGLVYNLLPFMIFPLYTNLERLDKLLLEAAEDLGATRTIIFLKVILPLSMPGIIAGCILVFLPAMTLFYISDFLGGAKSLLIGNLIRNTFLQTQDWPLGSALSISLLLIMSLLIALYYHYTQRNKMQQELV